MSEYFKSLLQAEKSAIDFIKDKKKVTQYLNGNTDQEERIMHLRITISWLDCVLLYLEGLSDEAQFYEQKIQNNAREILECYYPKENIMYSPPPAIKIIETEVPKDTFWKKGIGRLKREALECFFSMSNQIVLSHIASASSSYKPGEKYKQTQFSIPIQSKDGSIHNSYAVITCSVEFNWIEENFWGKICLEGDFLVQQIRYFYTNIEVKLVIENIEAGVFTCDMRGEFDIPKEKFTEIKEALDEKRLQCSLKLKESNEAAL